MARASGGEVVVYEAPDGMVRVDVWLERETVRLSWKHTAELFRRKRSVVTKYIRKGRTGSRGSLCKTCTYCR